MPSEAAKEESRLTEKKIDLREEAAMIQDIAEDFNKALEAR